MSQKEAISADVRDEYIRRVVGGKNFADVGGLWGTVNEKVSVAVAAGAERATMIDVTTAGAELWERWQSRLAELGIPECGWISGDICEIAARPDCPEFEVVHCSGVLYHHPSPLTLIQALRRVTRQHLVLTSTVVQETIENEHGRFAMPPSGVLFVPALGEVERRILAAYWREKAGVENCLGISKAIEWDPDDFAPWWWLPTATSMAAMGESCGFQLVDQASFWNNNASTLLLKVK